EMVLTGMDKFGQRWAKARAWWEGTDERSGPDRDIPGAIDELNDARRTLKGAIAEKLGASVEEQRRDAGGLREAGAASAATGAERAGGGGSGGGGGSAGGRPRAFAGGETSRRQIPRLTSDRRLLPEANARRDALLSRRALPAYRSID